MEVADEYSMADIDFTTSTTGVHVTWLNVFRDRHSDIVKFVLSLGTFVGGSDVTQEEVDGTLTSYKLTATLKEYQRYYVTVAAHNEAGLYSIAGSDGFMVDTN